MEELMKETKAGQTVPTSETEPKKKFGLPKSKKAKKWMKIAIAAVVIVAGMCLGPFSGYMVGALSAFLSNFLFGQGIWTPFQMVALGLVGLLAGMLLHPGRVNRWVLALVGFFLATVVYGLVVDLSTVLMTVTDFTWPAVLAVYASGAPFDLVFGGSTAVFLVLFGTPLEQKITRLQRKYGLLERKATAGDKENCHE